MTVHTNRTVGPTIWVDRKTDLLTDEQVIKMSMACHKQVFFDLAPVWATLHRPVKVLKPGKEVPRGDYVIELRDFSEGGTLGYHTELEGDVVAGVVGVGTILDAGKQVLIGDLSVSVILSHEVCEMVVNPSVSGWSDTGKGWLVATEVCDPVQNDYYLIDGVSVSNFCYPDFFSPVVSEDDKFDRMGILSAPFEIAPKGYVLNYEGGNISTYFGAVPPPEWLMAMKAVQETRVLRLKEHRPQ